MARFAVDLVIAGQQMGAALMTAIVQRKPCKVAKICSVKTIPVLSEVRHALRIAIVT